MRRRTWETAYIFAYMLGCPHVHLVVLHSSNERLKKSVKMAVGGALASVRSIRSSSQM